METLNYCIENSSKNSAERKALADYTRQNINGSHMLIGELEGTFFQYLISATQTQTILELGTYTGYSALTMAEALPPHGKLISLDINEKTQNIARDFLEKCPQQSKIELKLAAALEYLEQCVQNKQQFDLIFIDADKPAYPKYVEYAKKLITPNGSIIVDNVLWHNKAANPEIQDKQTNAIRSACKILADDPHFITVMLPIRDGILLATRNKSL
jgi:predicted O-methyltransferase YrrM